MEISSMSQQETESAPTTFHLKYSSRVITEPVPEEVNTGPTKVGKWKPNYWESRPQ